MGRQFAGPVPGFFFGGLARRPVCRSWRLGGWRMLVLDGGPEPELNLRVCGGQPDVEAPLGCQGQRLVASLPGGEGAAGDAELVGELRDGQLRGASQRPDVLAGPGGHDLDRQGTTARAPMGRSARSWPRRCVNRSVSGTASTGAVHRPGSRSCRRIPRSTGFPKAESYPSGTRRSSSPGRRPEMHGSRSTDQKGEVLCPSRPCPNSRHRPRTSSSWTSRSSSPARSSPSCWPAPATTAARLASRPVPVASPDPGGGSSPAELPPSAHNPLWRVKV